jgi:urease gamma subunit
MTSTPRARWLLALSLVCCAILLTACGLGGASASLDQTIYDEIKEGMSEEDVVDLLGYGYAIKNARDIPQDADENDPNVSLEYVWKDGGKTVTVFIRQGHVWSKQKSGF